jgi:hypothetical protein
MISGLEAFCDAIMQYEGWEPGSRSNRNRNPGNIRATKPEQQQDAEHFRVFGSLWVGWTELMRDVGQKFLGHTVTELGPDSTVQDFFNVWAPEADNNRPKQYASFVAGWLTNALHRPVSSDAKLRDIWPGIAVPEPPKIP